MSIMSDLAAKAELEEMLKQARSMGGGSTGPSFRGKLGENAGSPVSSPDMVPAIEPSPDMALAEVGESMGNVEELGKASANVAGMESIPQPTEDGSSFVAEGAAAAASKFNPYVLGAQVGLKLLEGQRKMKEKERQERFQAQQEVKSNMTSALSKLANIGAGLGL